MLLHRGGREIEIAATTDEAADRADRLQLETGAGPCLMAARDDVASASVGDTQVDQRWQPWRFDGDDLAVAHVLAQHAAVALARTRRELNLMQAIDATGPDHAG